MRGSVPYIKFDRMKDVPTVVATMWGQVRWKPGDGSTTADRLVLIGKNASGTVGEIELLNPRDAILQNTLEASGDNPTVTALAAAGDTATASVVFGNDIAGRVSVTTGGSGIATGAVLQVNFAANRPDTDYSVQVTPASSQAAPLGWYVTDRQVGSFDIAVTTAPGSGHVLTFAYLVIEDA